MAGLGELYVKILGDNKEFIDAVDKSQKKMKDFADAAEKFGKKMSLFVTTPIIALATASVKAVSTMEDLSVAFTTMLGDADKASKLLNDLREMAAKTPFQLTDLANASKTLLQFGVDSKEVLPTIRAIGDVSQGNADRFRSLSLAFGQVSSTGRLMGQDLLQMINAGFNPLKVISDQTGESMASLKDRMSEGSISAADVAEAFKIATSEGGMFFQGMEKASQTLSGRFSTLKDNAVELARGFGEILYPSANKLLDSIAKMVTKFSALDDSKKKLIITITKLAAVIGPLTLLTSKAITTVLALKKAYDVLWLSAASLNIALGPAVLIATLIAAAAAMVAWQVKIDRAKEAQEKYRIEIERQNEQIGILLPRYEELTTQTSLNAAEIDELNELVAELKELYPELTTSIDETTGALQFNQIELRTAAAATMELAINQQALNVAQAEGQRRTAQTALEYYKSLPAQQRTNQGLEIMENNLANATEAARTAGKTYKSMQEDLRGFNTTTEIMIAKLVKERTERKKTSATELSIIEAQAETIFDLMGEEGRMLILLDDIRKEQYQKEKDRRQEIISKTETSIGYINSLGEAVKNALEGNMKGLTDSITKTAQDIAKEFGPGGRIVSSFLSFSKTLNDIADKINEKIQGNLTRYYEGYKDVQLKIIDSNREANDQIFENTKRTLDKQLEAGIISQETYDKKLEEANKQQENSNRKLARERAEIEKKIALAQVEIDRNKAISELGWFNRDKKKEVNSLFDNLVAAIQGIPLPALKEGGIVMPRPGGTIARVAEAGIPEVIFPIDKLDQVINQIPSNNFGNSDLGGDIHLVVQMDSKPILEKIFPATRNRQILIDARAVV